MRQQLKDVLLIVRTDRRVWALGGFLVIALFLWALTSPGGGRQAMKPGMLEERASPQGSRPNEAYQDLMAFYKNEIELGKKERSQLSTTLQRVETTFKEHQQQTVGVFETLADKFTQLAHEVEALSEAVHTSGEEAVITPEPELEPADGIQEFGYTEPPGDEPPAPPAAPMRASVISPGDSVPVRLLTGVNAPTDGTPYPVVFQLDGPVTGPDGSSLELGQARLIAAAQGSEADGRVLFRLTNIALRHSDGRRSVIKVDGWIVGEDGIRGMKGKLIDKLGRLIVATAGVSFAAALGSELEDNTEVLEKGDGLTVNGGQFEYATASALTDASNRLGEIMLRRYESLVPVVEILSGRQVVAIFAETTEVDIIDDGDYPGGIYAASLD